MAEHYKLGDIDNERFYQVPKSLFINPKYKSMSNTSKMMYAILKDRMELSRKNSWHDENGDIFLLFDQQDMADLLGTSRVTINRYMKELKVARLIEPIRQGLGKPNKIYINKPQPYSSEHQDVSELLHLDVSELLYQNVSEFNSSDTEGNDTHNILSGKPDYTTIIHEVIDYLNNKLGTRYKYTSAKTAPHIKARVNEGFTVDDFKVVIDKKISGWRGTEWEKYLRPETLFGTKFEGYLNEKQKHSPSQPNKDTTKAIREEVTMSPEEYRRQQEELEAKARAELMKLGE